MPSNYLIGRTVDEWKGETPDAPFPPRVRRRILIRFNMRCAHCTRRIYPGDNWTADHIVALINGGENREFNGQPLCEWCNPKKNAADVAEKSRTARIINRDYGIREKPWRPMPGTRASGLRKRMNGNVERRA